MARQRLEREDGIDALELNMSCPNVTGGMDFSTSPEAAREVVARVRDVTDRPLIAKLSPNVTDPRPIAAGGRRGRRDGDQRDQHDPRDGRRLAPPAPRPGARRRGALGAVHQARGAAHRARPLADRGRSRDRHRRHPERRGRDGVLRRRRVGHPGGHRELLRPAGGQRRSSRALRGSCASSAPPPSARS